MNCIADITKIADNKINSADVLYNNNCFDDAFYLCGYAFELYLKAKVCKTLDIEDFFDFDNSKNRKIITKKKSNLENLYKPYKVHDYEQLIILSGLFNEFNVEIAKNQKMNLAWSIASEWNENLRYTIKYNQANTKKFIESIKELVQWMQTKI